MLSQIFIFPLVLEKLRKPHFSVLSALQVKKKGGVVMMRNQIVSVIKLYVFNIKSEPAIIYKILSNVKKSLLQITCI